ncbi:DUF4206 domain containing protein [Musa troglodytarum]|uniref:DUF4206 domain containing protein n=1 Tax=Musa troglodytarum TaxID=320322 RepID=A0A9E7GIY4_9LILI|nr:DUF4206 domain containing protein [Musa troglodytarum]
MEAGSPKAAPADPFDEFFPQQQGCASDADDASPSASNYSSCDGEDSELERYCSASLCSSVGNYADLLDFSDVCGAIENSQRGRLGGDIAASWDRFNRYSEEGAVASPRENGYSPSQHLLALSDRMGSLPRISTGSGLRPASVDRPGEKRVVEDQQEAVPCNGKEVDFLDRDVISMGRDDGYSGQSSFLCAMASAEEFGSLGNLGSSSRDAMMESDEDRPSRCEHSDGEDSMLEYGTDCENASGLSQNLRCIDETKYDNLPLLMNSSVAYGSDDLDELVRENGELGLQSLLLYQDQPNFQQTVPAKGDGNLPLLSNIHVIIPLHDVEKDEDAVDVSAVNHQFQVTDQPNSELSHKGKFLPGEYTIEDQIKSMYKGLKGDFYSISDGIAADVHVDEAPERRVFGEPASADNDTAIKISSISAGTSRHEKCFGQGYAKPSLSLPVVHSGQSSSFQIELDRSLNFTDLSEENIVTDEPMLCVSAINPLLFSKVPALLHVMGIRKNIGAMFPYIRCPFRISIQRGFGSRHHLLESNDFFALRDLVDLSKGTFSALPVMLETVSHKILEHITQQCLVCYDTGVPCAARQICDDPLSLIFPFQEAEAARCNSCGSIFHQPCFVKVINCTCGKSTNAVKNLDIRGHGESEKPLAVLIQPSKSSSSWSLFSNILLKASPDLIRRPKDRSPAIFMGSLSLSNTSLY